MTGNSLHDMSAVDALTAFRNGSLSPVEFLRGCRDQIDRLDGCLRAVTESLDSAEAAAKHAEQRYRAGVDAPLGHGDTALLGLPVLAKEKHQIRGHTLSQCIAAWRERVAENTHAVIERITAAGGYVHARTATPEYSCATVTHSPLYGVTRNPHSLEFSPGGSSGGSGAGLAAGYGPLATASDIAGSTRVPAGFCGVVGYKAPYGRIPGEPPLSADWYRGDGPMARTVADLALLTRVMQGVSSRDHTTVPGLERVPLEFPDPASWLAGKRIAVCTRLGDYAVHPDVVAAFEKTAASLAGAGARVEEVELPWTTARIREISMAHYGQILAPAMRRALAGVEGLAAYTERFMAEAEAAAAATTLPETLAAEAQLQAELAAVMADCEVLLTPVNAVVGLRAESDYLDGFHAVAPTGRTVHLGHYWEGHMTVPFNICNRCPVIAVPIGRAANGVPIGMQIVGPPFREELVFRAAAAVEAVQPWPLLADMARVTEFS